MRHNLQGCFHGQARTRADMRLPAHVERCNTTDRAAATDKRAHAQTCGCLLMSARLSVASCEGGRAGAADTAPRQHANGKHAPSAAPACVVIQPQQPQPCGRAIGAHLKREHGGDKQAGAIGRVFLRCALLAQVDRLTHGQGGSMEFAAPCRTDRHSPCLHAGGRAGRRSAGRTHAQGQKRQTCDWVEGSKS